MSIQYALIALVILLWSNATEQVCVWPVATNIALRHFGSDRSKSGNRAEIVIGRKWP